MGTLECYWRTLLKTPSIHLCPSNFQSLRLLLALSQTDSDENVIPLIRIPAQIYCASFQSHHLPISIIFLSDVENLTFGMSLELQLPCFRLDAALHSVLLVRQAKTSHLAIPMPRAS